MLWQFTVGARVKGKADRIVVHAEDALVAALKVKAERPDATIMYVRRLNRRGDTRHPPHTLTGGRNQNRSLRDSVFWKEAQVTYIVNESCIRCKYTDCVEVCPVDCFYEGENMLVIHPDECIDCGVCEPECPVDAIKPDTEPGLEKWLDLNRQYSAVWPNITRKKPAPPDADAFVNVPDKFAKYFSPNPGEGD